MRPFVRVEKYEKYSRGSLIDTEYPYSAFYRNLESMFHMKYMENKYMT